MSVCQPSLPFSADSRENNPPERVLTRFSAKTSQNTGFVTIHPESATFDFELTIGIGEETGPLVGGVRGRMAGCGAGVLYEACAL